MAEFRNFNWCSSIDLENSSKLLKLNSDLEQFYSKPNTRGQYNAILERKGIQPEADGAEKAFLELRQIGNCRFHERLKKEEHLKLTRDQKLGRGVR